MNVHNRDNIFVTLFGFAWKPWIVK